MFKKLLKFRRRFSRDVSGSVSVEAAIILPLLLWSFIAMWVFFDAYRTRALTEKAAFVVSDMFSRETGAITETYMASAKSLFDLLAESDSASGLRTTVISYSRVREQYEMEWSNAQGNIEPLNESELPEIVAKLPEMVDGETLILVETKSTYEPSLNVGLGDQNLTTFVFTRPRFASQLVWDRELGNS
ncbi:hypothetical protein SAMN05444000_10849 [Shimia gijangensis]|uniref:Flp pilus assembly protein TadG n=1 Tax=Shimia gijangensis TaxID=1470563 RepID=A0A1M6IYH1_9RHOB|nr:hypothetical protein [Shimia gijangensis]SHJ39483.1 hypothetical protein SAMN05444000_10849 [Shimia gijangensis]